MDNIAANRIKKKYNQMYCHKMHTRTLCPLWLKFSQYGKGKCGELCKYYTGSYEQEELTFSEYGWPSVNP